ncbi:hypothetical protein, partial [Salmonella enterica]
PPRHREMLGFTHAKALEDQGDYLHAFDAFAAANASRRKRTPWDAAGERKRVDDILRVATQDAPPPVDPQLGKEVILI